MTDFENASFVVFIVLLSRAIMSMNLNFYIPISKVGTSVEVAVLRKAPDMDPGGTQVDENMRRAQQRDAVNQATFFFRREIFTPASSRATSGVATPDDSDAFSRPSSTLPTGGCPGADARTPAPSNGTTNGSRHGHSSRPKHRVMANCFPPPPAPSPEEAATGGSVGEEYAEYTMDEIINGRVSGSLQNQSHSA